MLPFKFDKFAEVHLSVDLETKDVWVIARIKKEDFERLKKMVGGGKL